MATTIPELNAADQVSSNDMVPIFKTDQGNAMRVAASAFVGLVAGTAIEEMEQIKAETQAIADDLGSFPEAIAEMTVLRDQTNASAADSAGSASAAAGSEAGAQGWAAAAEAAVDALNTTGKVFTYAEGTAAGIAATTTGQQFAVLNVDATGWNIYRNDSGSPLQIGPGAYTSAYIDAAFDAGKGVSLYSGTDYAPIWTDATKVGILAGIDLVTGKPVGYYSHQLLAMAAEATGAAGAQIMTYSGTGTQPVVVGADRGIALGIDPTTGQSVGPMGGSTRYERTTPIPLALSAIPATLAVNGFISYGQSLSVGAQGQPPISTTQPYSNLTHAGGPKAAAGQTASKPLVEDSLAEGGVTGNNRGETICSGMSNSLVERAAIENGRAPSGLVMYSSAPGQGGQPIASLKKGTTYWTRLLAHVTNARDICASESRGAYAMHALAWVQGETDQDNGTSRATYKAELMQLRTDANTDITAITGQGTPVHILTSQTPYKARLNSGAVQLATIDAVRDGTNLHFVTPFYHLPYNADATHLTNVGYLWLGQYFGRAGKQLMVDGVKPDCIWPLSATVRGAAGTTLRIKLRVPQRPLVLDLVTLAATADYGFKVTDSTGTLTLSGFKIVDGDTVEVTLNRALTSTPVARYALDFLGSGLNISSGASGNLRDSTSDTFTYSGTTYRLYHVCPAFELPITILA